MAFVIKDRIKEGTTTTGTGAVSLGGASATFEPFSSYMTNGDTTYYAIVHTASGVDEWEVGLGTWNTGNTLTRTTVIAGTNDGSPVDFSAGTKGIFMTYPASIAAYTDASGDLSGDIGLGNHSTTELVEGSNLYYTDARVDAHLSGGTGVTYNAGAISIGQDVATTADVTFNTVTGDLTGNADTATSLESSRTIQLTGDVTGSATFNGTANAVITATVQDDSHAHVISNVDGLQSALDAKVDDSTTITAGSGLTGGGSIGVNRTISHADTSTQASLTALTGAAVVSDVDVDTYGHVTGLATRNMTLADLGYTGETNATADQTAGEIKTAYESNANTNAYTDAEKSKLEGIASGAEVNTVDSVNTQTGAVVLDADDISDSATTNKFTTAAEISKLEGIEAGANVTDTANVTAAGALMDSEITNLAQVKAFDSADYATAAQGTLASSALQSGDNISELVNDSGYVTTDTTYTAGSGLSLVGTEFTNIAPDQTVAITGGANVTVTGTYPNFTIASTDTNTQLSSEQVQDIVGAMFTGNTESGISVVYQDTDGTIDINVNDPTITLSGDVSGSATMTDLGNVNISVTIADDSHNHTIANVDGLQSALDGKVDDSQVLTNVPSGAVFTDTVYTHPSSHPASIITTTDEFTYSNSSNVQDVLDDLDQAIANVNAKDPVLTLTGDVSGSATFTNLGNATLSVTIADDSHNHTIANIDGLQTALNGKTTESYVNTQIANLVDTAPATMDTLNELAAALGDDPNFATTVSSQIGAKLDSSAYTASDVLTKVKTVDGSGSGLDADLLDGQHGSYYYPASNPNGYTTYTANQALNTNSNPTFNDVYVADQILHSGDTDTYIQFHAGDQWRVVTGGAERLEVNNTHVYASRQIRSNNNITAYYSDVRLKTKTGTIDNALDKVNSLEGFYYVENEVARENGYNNDKQQVALSAQDVQVVMPEAIHPAPFDVGIAEDGSEYSKSGKNFLTVDYARLVPLLVEAIKELKAKLGD